MCACNTLTYPSNSTNNWRHVASRPKRPLRSIVLDPGIKDLLIGDAKDFLESKSWYADRGIPFRRGYLLHGAPGSGKTSMIHSLAGELGLDVYVLSLSRAGLDDSALAELIGDLPERCIALMEDIDAAFGGEYGLENRDLEGVSAASVSGQTGQYQNQNQNNGQGGACGPRSTASRITLSGLLNAIDGIGAHDGRLLYATTNKYEALDQALCRPGRMDLHVEFRLGSRWQAAEMFKCFFMPSGEDKNEGKMNVSGYSSPIVESLNQDLIDWAEEKIITPVSEDLPTPPTTCIGSYHRTRGPTLSASEIDDLATVFSDSIPEREFSMATLQGYLMSYKTRPFEAAWEVGKWVGEQRAEKAEKMRTKMAARSFVAQEKVIEMDGSKMKVAQDAAANGADSV